jgi:hypothetical protein
MKNSRLTAIAVAFVTSLLLIACGQKTEVSLNCPDMAQGCSIESLNVSTNHSPQILQPFELSVRFNGDGMMSPSEVYASFAMDGMEMGLNRYRMVKKAGNLWVAEVTLPVCVRGRADWILEIESNTRLGTKRYIVSFQTG